MTACRDWKESLLDLALGEPPAPGLEKHLAVCPACSAALADLRARSRQLDAALPQLVRGAEPSPALRPRVLAAVEAEAAPTLARPAWAGILVALAVFLLAIVSLPRLADRRTRPGVPPKVTLSEWRSPTEALLRSPGDELLRSTPRLGETYFPLETPPAGAKKNKGGNNES